MSLKLAWINYALKKIAPTKSRLIAVFKFINMKRLPKIITLGNKS